MKRISLKVARALKEAGYKFIPAPSSFFTNETNSWFNNEDRELYSLPTYLEAWLWLWREKKISILLNNGAVVLIQNTDLMWHIVYQNNYSDPEDAIANAIEYLVDNDLIK